MIIGLALRGGRAEPKIVGTIIVFRHGARNPIKLAKLVNLEQSRGELTKKGEKQLRDLGEKLRKKYREKGLIEEKKRGRYILFSSYKGRTEKSAEQFLEGFDPRGEKTLEKFERTLRSPDYESYLEQIDHDPNSKESYAYAQESKKTDYMFHGFSGEVCPRSEFMKNLAKRDSAVIQKTDYFRTQVFSAAIREMQRLFPNFTLDIETMTLKDLSAILDLDSYFTTHSKELRFNFSTLESRLLFEAKNYQMYFVKFGNQ